MKSLYYAILSLFLATIWAGMLPAQQTSSNKITIILQGTDVKNANGVLHIQDSLAAGMAVESITVNNESLWLKKENAPPERRGVVHFWFDKQNHELILYFSKADLENWDNEQVRLVIVGVGGKIHPTMVIRGSNGEVLPINP